MAAFLDKVNVPTALDANTRLCLDHVHQTSADFMQLNVSMAKEMVPKEKIEVNMETFARCSPLPTPCMGRASMRSRGFFVPYRTVYQGFTDMITNAVHVPSTTSENSFIPTVVPTVDNYALVHAFTAYDYSTAIDPSSQSAWEAAMLSDNMVWTSSTSMDAYDVYVATRDANDDLAYVNWNFTKKGQQAIKLLESLGYKVLWQDFKSDEDSGYCNPIYSAMPLLCLCKVVTDYYWPTQYRNLQIYDRLVSLTKQDVSDNITLDADAVHDILAWASYVMYDSDAWVSTFDNPMAPTNGNYSSFSFFDASIANGLSNLNTQIVTAANGTPYMRQALSTNVNIGSQYIHDMLKGLTDYVKRNQLASDSFSRYLSHYGKALTAEKLNRSIYLGCFTQDVQVGDVMSTADTSSSGGDVLGSYAGKAMSAGSGDFSYASDEYGMFLILTSIVPASGYFQGVDRLNCCHTTLFDFYQGEMDNLGCSAVSSSEIYCPQTWEIAYAGLDTHIWGWLPRYYEYKSATGMDRLTGNFRLNTINGSTPLTPANFNAANAWHLFRTFDNSDFSSSDSITHDVNFIRGFNDFGQYKRIFEDVSPAAPDNFILTPLASMVTFSP